MLRFVLFAFAFWLSSSLAAAQALSLEQAVDLAVSRSLVVEGGELDQRLAQSQLVASQLARVPSLNGNATAGYQFGLNPDPTTNTLIQQTIGFNSYSLDAGLQLFGGGQIKNTINQARTRIAASEASLANLTQQVSLDVAQAYLQVLLSEDELRSGLSQLQDAQQALDRVDARIRVGSAASADRYPLDSELARQQQVVTMARNTVSLNYLTLRQLLRLDSSETLELTRLDSISEIEVSLPTISGDNIYRKALQNQPSIKAAQLNEEVAQQEINIAKSAYYPTLRAFGQLNTRYSSQAKTFQTGEGLVDMDQEVRINGESVTITTSQPSITEVPLGFSDQLQQFFGQSVGVQLTVPFFNNGQTRARVQNATIQYQRASVQTEQAKLQLEIDVQQAYQAAVSARDQVTAADRAFVAADATYNAAVRRLEVGAGSSYEVSNSQVLREQASISLLRARYQYLFNAKVVEFYLGKPLSLN